MSRVIIGMLSLLMLSGCEKQPPHSDLQRYIFQTYATSKATATQFPSEPHYIPLPFLALTSLDPFVFPLSKAAKDSYLQGDCWQPDDLPEKDILENYELGSLRFKGVMGLSGRYWALLETPDKSIHRVGVGRMLGSNRGRVDSISKQTLSITEHLPDGLGCWQVRKVRLALINHD